MVGRETDLGVFEKGRREERFVGEDLGRLGRLSEILVLQETILGRTMPTVARVLANIHRSNLVRLPLDECSSSSS